VAWLDGFYRNVDMKNASVSKNNNLRIMHKSYSFGSCAYLLLSLIFLMPFSGVGISFYLWILPAGASAEEKEYGEL
jgi:hypothetical protein